MIRSQREQEVLAGDAEDVADLASFGAAIEQEALALRIVFAECREGAEILGPDARRIPDFDREDAAFTGSGWLGQ